MTKLRVDPRSRDQGKGDDHLAKCHDVEGESPAKSPRWLPVREAQQHEEPCHNARETHPQMEKSNNKPPRNEGLQIRPVDEWDTHQSDENL
jgi:hypothetical protein